MSKEDNMDFTSNNLANVVKDNGKIVKLGDNVLFKYDLKDAIGFPIKSIIITEDNNMYLCTESEVDVKSTIEVDELNSLLSKHVKKIEALEDHSLPNIPVLDGYINTIEIKVDDKKYEYSIDNLDYYGKEDLKNNKFLSLIVKLLDDVYEELYKQEDKIKEYLVLTDDEVEESV